MTGPAAAFTAVDAAADPVYLIGYLDRTAAALAAVKDRMLALLERAAGQTVLDVGCGTGDDARAVAALVGPSGRGGRPGHQPHHDPGGAAPLGRRGAAGGVLRR